MSGSESTVASNPKQHAGARLARTGAALAAAAFLACGAAEAADCRSAPAAGVDWQDCDKRIIILSGSRLDGANLSRVDFTSTDLRNSSLLAANLEKATLVRASLADSKAQGANFTHIEAYRTDFSRIDARGAVFATAEMQRSDFTAANLAGADFTKAEMGRALLVQADITGARFSLANLARADLRTSKFSGPIDFASAFFFLTRIEGLDLSQATGLAQWQIDMSCGDAKTVLPAGLTPSATWPCMFEND